MRNVKIGLIAVLCVITVGLCGILAYGMTGHHIYGNWFHASGDRNGTDARLVLEQEIPLDGIESISIRYDMNSNDIYIHEGETDSVIVKEYCYAELHENEISTVTTDKNRLEIKGKRRNHMGFSAPFAFGYADGYAEVWIPASYQGALELKTASGDISIEQNIHLEGDFLASSVSGDMRMSDISAQNVTMASTSGFLKIQDIQTDTIHITTTSGDISLNKLMGETTIGSTSGNATVDAISGNAQFSSVSGDVDIRQADGNVRLSTTSGFVRILGGSGDRSASSISGDVTLEGVDGSLGVSTTSGEIRIKAQKGSGDIGTTSGDIRLELTELTGSLNINSTSGEVDIRMPDSNSFDFAADSTSGDIDTFFDDVLKFSKKGDSARGTYGANAQGYRIGIKTTSGDVHVRPMN